MRIADRPVGYGVLDAPQKQRFEVVTAALAVPNGIRKAGITAHGKASQCAPSMHSDMSIVSGPAAGQQYLLSRREMDSQRAQGEGPDHAAQKPVPTCCL
jgi:hypothetical protein